MESILQGSLTGSNQEFVVLCLILAVGRVYLELVKAPLGKLPLSSRLFGDNADRFHKMGLYISLGYIVLFAPGLLFA